MVAGGGTHRVVEERVPFDADLLGDMPEGSIGDQLTGSQEPPGKAQRAELEGKAEPVVRVGAPE